MAVFFCKNAKMGGFFFCSVLFLNGEHSAFLEGILCNLTDKGLDFTHDEEYSKGISGGTCHVSRQS